MSNPFEDEDNEILEGFLCPICKSDLKTPEKLTNHVEQEHSEEQDLLKSLKEIFSIAKKRILNLDETTTDLARSLTIKDRFSNQKKVAIINPIFQYQEVGADCDHISYFRAVRNPRLERYASETNKLIIRLNKLLTNLPTDADQRKKHEQQIVPWLEGKSVNLCPNCAKSFGLTRRQHHCRLCGSIMCHDCSLFLSLPDSISIVSPSLLSPSQIPKVVESKEKEANNGFRVCEHCLHLLENRKEMQDSRTIRPLMTKLYEKIIDIRRDIEPDIPMYSKIVNSLYEGNSIFKLSDASALREKIGRSAENIDQISRHILSIQFAQGSREESLKKAIRLSCVSYIKERMLEIPPLPLEEEIKKLQLQRSREISNRIEKERQMAMEAYDRYELQSDVVKEDNTKVVSAFSTMDNWSSYQSKVVPSTTGDPLIEQINIIKGYIVQAREAMRFEEVATLEMNLNELKQEFYNRQQNNQ